jgi:hypothetical protein
VLTPLLYSEGRGAAAEVDLWLMNNTRLPAAGGIKARVHIPIYLSLKTVPYFGFAALYPTPDQHSRRYPSCVIRRSMSSKYTVLPFGTQNFSSFSLEVLAMNVTSVRKCKCMIHLSMDQYIRASSVVATGREIGSYIPQEQR